MNKKTRIIMLAFILLPSILTGCRQKNSSFKIRRTKNFSQNSNVGQDLGNTGGHAQKLFHRVLKERLSH